MKSIKPRPAWLAWPALLAATAVLLPSCVKFVKLESDLDFLAGTYIISSAVENAERYPRLYGLVVEWDRAKRAGNQYVLAYNDAMTQGLARGRHSSLDVISADLYADAPPPPARPDAAPASR